MVSVNQNIANSGGLHSLWSFMTIDYENYLLFLRTDGLTSRMFNSGRQKSLFFNYIFSRFEDPETW